VAVLVSIALCCLCGCWIDRRGGVGLSVGPTIAESYQLSGIVTGLGVVERPLVDARVSAVYQGKELSSVLTDMQGRFFIDVDRGPLQHPMPASSAQETPPGGVRGVDALMANPVVVSSGGEAVLHNYAAIQTHEHWTVELHVTAPGFRTGKVQVNVPRDLSKEPVKVLLVTP